MANKRDLKREINYITGELFTECLFNKVYMSTTDNEVTETLLSKIITVQDNFLSRVNRPDGKDNPKLVKKYYQTLISEFDTAIEEILNAMTPKTK